MRRRLALAVALTAGVATAARAQTAPIAPLAWQQAATGVRWAETPWHGDGEASRLRLIVVELDLTRVRLAVTWGVTSDAKAGWSVARAPSTAVVALNAGQFTSTLPWGWVVADGRERLPPGRGPLSMALVARRDGSVALIDGDTLQHLRADPSVIAAFQSYPTLLRAGTVPRELQLPCPIDCTHRDARLALGMTATGRLLIAMTRFDAVGEALGFVPFGVTVPEMSGIMQTLGAQNAVLLDGGISAQLMIRSATGQPRTWPGIRKVPLALLAFPR